jgi:aminopeptidase N
MYDGDAPRQAMLSRYASAKLSPVLDRLGWAARPGEAAPATVLRSALIATLGGMGDPRVLAEARRRFASTDPAALRGPLRSTILGIVAAHADAATWDRIRARARAEKDSLLRTEYYELLGAARDEALARRALALALTTEPGATDSAEIISAVAGGHPEMAYDFALANKAAVEAFVDASTRPRYLPGLAGGSADPATVAKLQDFAQRYMTAQSRRPADIAIASIQDRVRVRRERLPDITRWLEARARG